MTDTLWTLQPAAYLRLVVDAGWSVDRYEAWLADLLTQGAGGRNAKQFAEDIAFVGGTLESSSGAEQTVLDTLDRLSLTPANFNGGGQIVAAGALGDLAELAATPPHGTRVMPLKVAGAFHTAYMAPAVDTLRAAAVGVEASDPDLTLWTNHDGTVVGGGRQAVDTGDH